MGFSIEDVCAPLTDEQTEIVEEYTEYVFDTLDMLHEKFGSENVKVWIEERVYSNISKDYNGTADFAAKAGRTLGIIDLKAGYNPVTTRDEAGNLNEQLASYAVCFLDQHKLWDEIDKVRLTIVQPRVYEKPQTVVADIQELFDFSVRVTKDIRQIENGDDTLKPGSWCKYCPARGRCPALRKAAVEIAKCTFDDVPKHAREYSPDELEAILDEAELIQAHIDGIRMHVRLELEKGRTFKNWKLVPKRAMSKWVDEHTALEEIADRSSGAMAMEIMYQRKPRTPNQVVTILKEKNIPISVIEKYWHKESSGTTLARIDDARPATKADPFD
jgi:hypothetical protein